jgi:predicted ATPase
MDYIEIKGYKSIKEVKIDLKPINIFIGSNGSGKSNFISFFEFLDNLYNKNLQAYIGLRGGINKYLYKGLENASKIEGFVRFKDGINSYSFVLEPSGDSFVISKEVLWYHENPLEFREFTREAQVKNNGWYRGKFIQKYLVGHKKYHFHDTGQSSPFNAQMNIDQDSLILYEQGENLAPILFKIRQNHPKIYNRIVMNIQSIAPYFSDFVLNPNEKGFVGLYWNDKYSRYIYNVTDFSDGTIRFIALSILFMQPNLPKTIVLDEPELGLHPQAIAKLAGMIQSATLSESQVIIATQSADLISYFNPDDIIAVDNNNGYSEFSRLDAGKLQVWLEDYTLGDLWRKNIITKAQPF